MNNDTVGQGEWMAGEVPDEYSFGEHPVYSVSRDILKDHCYWLTNEDAAEELAAYLNAQQQALARAEASAAEWKAIAEGSDSYVRTVTDKLRERAERAEAQLKRCGGDNCMGLEVDGLASWVRKERLEEAEAQLSQAVTLLASLRVTCTNDGPDECKDCLGFGVSPDTGASCGTVYTHPSAQERLVRAEAALSKILGMAVPLGYDAGHSGIADVARAALAPTAERAE